MSRINSGAEKTCQNALDYWEKQRQKSESNYQAAVERTRNQSNAAPLGQITAATAAVLEVGSSNN